MIMRNSLLRTFASLTTLCLVLAIASTSFGQFGEYRYRGHGRASIDRLIRQAENRSDQFVMVFDRALDNSRLEGSIREDRLNERAQALESQLNVVRQTFNSTQNQAEIRWQIGQALNLARPINNVMQNRRLDLRAERQWMLLRSALDQLARVYNFPQLR